jgi:hypothetical protein
MASLQGTLASFLKEKRRDRQTRWGVFATISSSVTYKVPIPSLLFVIPASCWRGSIRNAEQMDSRYTMSGMTAGGMQIAD